MLSHLGVNQWKLSEECYVDVDSCRSKVSPNFELLASITRPFSIFGHQNSFVSAIFGLVVIASQERAARTRLSRIAPMWHRLVSQSEF